MKLWKYNKTTGYWFAVREVTPETAQQWLTIWQQAEPAEQFKVASRKPR